MFDDRPDNVIELDHRDEWVIKCGRSIDWKARRARREEVNAAVRPWAAALFHEPITAEDTAARLQAFADRNSDAQRLCDPIPEDLRSLCGLWCILEFVDWSIAPAAIDDVVQGLRLLCERNADHKLHIEFSIFRWTLSHGSHRENHPLTRAQKQQAGEEGYAPDRKLICSVIALGRAYALELGWHSLSEHFLDIGLHRGQEFAADNEEDYVEFDDGYWRDMWLEECDEDDFAMCACVLLLGSAQRARVSFTGDNSCGVAKRFVAPEAHYVPSVTWRFSEAVGSTLKPQEDRDETLQAIDGRLAITEHPEVRALLQYTRSHIEADNPDLTSAQLWKALLDNVPSV